MHADPPLPMVFNRLDAERAGLSRHQISRRVACGRWKTLRRNAFCLASRWDAATPAERHVLAGRAALLCLGGPVYLSHLTAATLWGLPTPLRDSWPVYVTRPAGRRPARRSDDLVVEVAALPASQRCTLTGLQTCTPPRVVADVLRHHPPAESVPVADAALHRGLLSLAELDDVLAMQAEWPYARRGATSRPLIDGRRESWLESMSAVTFSSHGLDLPQPQVTVLDDEGRFVARVDFLWEGEAVVGEADGAVKYRVEGPPEQAAEVLVAEKDREDRLRDLGLEVVRWTTGDLLGRPVAVIDRIRRARVRGNPARFRGTLLASEPPVHTESRNPGAESP